MAAGAGRNGRRRNRLQRGSTLVESAVVAATFLLMLAGIMECARLGFAYNAVSFAAQRAARYAAVRGSSSGHAATANDVEAAAKTYTAALDNSKVTVTTTWTPDNRPGSTVQVKVTYDFATALVPLAAGLLTLHSTTRHIVTQ